MSPPSTQPLRIAHVSDVHVTHDPRTLRWRDLLTKRLAGWANLRVAGRYARFQDAPAVIEAFCRDLEALALDFVVFSGDVTALSRPSEFEHARTLLDPLLARDDVLGIPGNHDVYVRRDARERPFSKHFGAWERTDLPELACTDEAPYPLVRLVGETVALVAVHSARPTPIWSSAGRIGTPQLEALRTALADPRVASRHKLIVCHYAPRRQSGRPDTPLHGVRDAEALLEVAGAGGATAILHGHLHRRFVHSAGTTEGGAPVGLLCPGSLTDAHRERSYHIYEVGDDALRIEVRRYRSDVGAFEAVVDPEGPRELSLCSRAQTGDS